MRRDVGELQRRVTDVEQDLATNRMTRMAPETRIELDGVHREMDGLWRRIQALEEALNKLRR